MNFHKPNNLVELFKISENISSQKYFLAGGTDINVQIKHRMIQDADIIYINELEELKGITKTESQVEIGALTTFSELLQSALIRQYFPILTDNLVNFASPLLQTTATIGGNIANGSPTADIMPLLLVLDAKLVITGKSGTREQDLSDFYFGYKKNSLKDSEIIKSVIIEKSAQLGFDTFYQKVGARKTLTIAKVSLAGLIKKDADKIIQIKLAAGSLNEFARRLPKLEKYLTNCSNSNISKTKLTRIIKEEITPISDLRSDAIYRLNVFINLILKLINQ